MKTLFTKSIGSDGATITVGIDEVAGNLVLGATYPMSKIMGPVDKALDDLTARLESALGNSGWAKAILDPLDEAAKAELQKLIGAP